MALNGDVLGLAIKAAITAVDPTDNDAVFKAVGQAIVAHFVANATITVAVASVSGVTTGPGVSGPGTGTGTLT